MASHSLQAVSRRCRGLKVRFCRCVSRETSSRCRPRLEFLSCPSAGTEECHVSRETCAPRKDTDSNLHDRRKRRESSQHVADANSHARPPSATSRRQVPSSLHKRCKRCQVSADPKRTGLNGRRINVARRGRPIQHGNQSGQGSRGHLWIIAPPVTFGSPAMAPDPEKSRVFWGATHFDEN